MRTIAKFDEEDLQLLGYMPHRDDFERVNENQKIKHKLLCFLGVQKRGRAAH